MSKKQKSQIVQSQSPLPPITPLNQSDFDDLNRRLKLSSWMIRNLNTALVLFTFLLPLTTYLGTYILAIKPSEDALRDLERNVDKKIAVFIENNRRVQIDTNVQLIAKGSTHQVLQAVTYLNSVPNLQLSGEQLVMVLTPMRNDIIEEQIKLAVGNLVVHMKNPVVDEYYKDKLLHEQVDFQLVNLAITHFTTYEYKGDLVLFERAMENKLPKDRAMFYYFLTSNCRDSNQTWLMPLLNSKKLVDESAAGYQDGLELAYWRRQFGQYTDLNKDDFKNTYFFTKK